MVLAETYKILASEAQHLTQERRLSLILGALFHDIAKPLTTREQEIENRIRIVAPRHASKGRSYLAPKLMGLGLSYQVVEEVLGLVGYHHEPKKLVIKNCTPGDYKRVARLADPELLYWLELADIRGRECQDKQQQLDYIEMYGLFSREYQAWQRFGAEYQTWRQYFNRELTDFNSETRDLVFANAIANLEAGKIFSPEEEIARSYSYRESYPQVVLTFGVSGSGKSTWIVENLPDHCVISLDNLRAEITGDRANQRENNKVLIVAKERLKNHLRSHHKIVWDATGLRRDFRQQVISVSRNYGALITLVIFHCEESIYWERNRTRRYSIPESVLTKQIEGMEFPELDEAHRILIVDNQGKTLAHFNIEH
ncbi:MAG: AAA family ATPase [Pleurocapsa sp.]